MNMNDISITIDDNSNEDHFDSRLEISNNNVNPDKSEAYEFTGEDFQKLVRVGFIRKVYGVLIVQLILTLLLSFIGLNESVSSIYKENSYLIWVFTGTVVLILTIITAAIFGY